MNDLPADTIVVSERRLPAPGPDWDYPRSFERAWLPILGPTTYLLGCRLSAMLASRPPGGLIELDMRRLATQFGVVPSGGSRAPIRRSLNRLIRFALAEESGWTYQVFVRWPPNVVALDHVRQAV